MPHYVVIGAGIAGHRAAVELRKLDAAATIDLIGDEPSLPYDRPPLSKDVLLGKITRTTLRDADRYETLRIRFHRGVRALSIDRVARVVHAEHGLSLPYDALLLATGSRPRLLPSSIAAPGVPLCYLRTEIDAAHLREKLRPGSRVAIIGGGFIGLETAASARTAGCTVTVIETADRILSRGLLPEAARYVHRLHERNGIEILTGARLERVAVNEDGSYTLFTSSGTLHADTVVVGIGVVPNVELALEAGLHVEDGIVVDGLCRTSDPAIFAAGEVTSHTVPLLGQRRRIESWKIAQTQPVVAAAAMVGQNAAEYAEIPWLWSDQFDLNLQMLGVPERAVSFRTRGDPDGASWTIVGLDENGLPVSGLAINAGRDIALLRRAMARGSPLPEDFFQATAAAR